LIGDAFVIISHFNMIYHLLTIASNSSQVKFENRRVGSAGALNDLGEILSLDATDYSLWERKTT